MSYNRQELLNQQTTRREKRRKDKPKKQKLISLPKLLKKAESVFNIWIRKRDEGMKCISCNNRGNQAGHFFPVKSHSALRFHEWNVNLQDAYCNCYLHGNLIYYRMGLVEKIGEDKVKALELQAIKLRGTYKWSREELNMIIAKYSLNNIETI